MTEKDMYKRLLSLPVGTTLTTKHMDKTPFNGGRSFNEMYEIGVDDNGDKMLIRIERWYETDSLFMHNHKRIAVSDRRSRKLKNSIALKRFFGYPDIVRIYSADTCECVEIYGEGPDAWPEEEEPKDDR